MLKKGQHGGNIFKAAEALGCEASEIIDFSSNINNYRPDLDVTIAAHTFSHYGDPDYKDLKRAVASRYEVKNKEIALFNGASSAIFELFRHLKAEETTLYTPIYSEYTRAAGLFSQKSTKIDRFDELYKKPAKRSTVVFVNPGTPDGRYYDLEKLFRLWKRQQCTIILDESFLEFTRQPSLRAEIKEYKRLYIVQSFTKFYGCAGLRVGAIFSHAKSIRALLQPAWNLSSLDAAYVTALLENETHSRDSIALYQKQYKALRKTLKGSGCFEKVYKSSGNYILTRSEQATKIYRQLFQEKILVRDCSNFDGLDARYLRFALKDKDALKALKKALHHACT